MQNDKCKTECIWKYKLFFVSSWGRISICDDQYEKGIGGETANFETCCVLMPESSGNRNCR